MFEQLNELNMEKSNRGFDKLFVVLQGVLVGVCCLLFS